MNGCVGQPPLTSCALTQSERVRPLHLLNTYLFSGVRKGSMKMKPLFPLGQVVATPQAIDLLEQVDEYYLDYLERHVTGDWSEMSEEDQKENRYSVDKYLRIFSSYTLDSGERIWIITEADRSSTTILLPEEY